MNSAFYIGVDPVIFRLGPLSIGWYGLMITLAIVTVISWLVWQNSRNRLLTPVTLLAVALIGITSGIVFAKLAHVIDLFGYYLQNPGKIFSGEGFAIWGAVLGAVIGIWIYSKVSQRFRFSLFVDMLAPGMILAQAVGRVGCTLNGCCYGIESNSPLAFIYTNPNTYAPVGIPVLPTQVFELFFALAVFGVLIRLRGKLKPDGSLFIVYLALYAAWRFGIDFIRDGTPFFKNIHFLTNVPFLSDLHQAQVIGLIILLITIPMLILRTRWVKKEEPLEAEA
jgi:phosphatidylglycerol:prolipoprotein diacylglycerol transferase